MKWHGSQLCNEWNMANKEILDCTTINKWKEWKRTEAVVTVNTFWKKNSQSVSFLGKSNEWARDHQCSVMLHLHRVHSFEVCVDADIKKWLSKVLMYSFHIHYVHIYTVQAYFTVKLSTSSSAFLISNKEAAVQCKLKHSLKQQVAFLIVLQHFFSWGITFCHIKHCTNIWF